MTVLSDRHVIGEDRSEPVLELGSRIRIDRIRARRHNELVTNEAMWLRILERDRRSDGRFVYGVVTTGVYCRPSCSSRRPLQHHVRFFADGPSAEREGFRACRRCGGRVSPPTDAGSLVERACRLLAALPPGRSLPLSRLAADLGVGADRLRREFTTAVGVSPRQYLEALRTGRLKRLLRGGQPVTAALYAAGYGSSSRLYERADAELGMTPAAYRRGGPHMHIHFVVVRSALGYLLVGATERGVCSVKLGSAAKALEDDLRREYPKAVIDRDLGKQSPAVTALVEFVAGQRPPMDLPLDVQGTAFQRKVWASLQRIPLGLTRSYGEIAKAIGRPGAARAVARACSSNHAALLIPCHRVVAGDGSVGGYHWGVERKKRLLDVERQLVAGSVHRRA